MNLVGARQGGFTHWGWGSNKMVPNSLDTEVGERAKRSEKDKRECDLDGRECKFQGALGIFFLFFFLFLFFFFSFFSSFPECKMLAHNMFLINFC